MFQIFLDNSLVVSSGSIEEGKLYQVRGGASGSDYITYNSVQVVDYGIFTGVAGVTTYSGTGSPGLVYGYDNWVEVTAFDNDILYRRLRDLDKSDAIIRNMLEGSFLLIGDDFDICNAFLTAGDSAIRMQLHQDSEIIWNGWAQLRSDNVDYNEKTLQINGFETSDEYSRRYAAYNNTRDVLSGTSPSATLTYYNDGINPTKLLGSFNGFTSIITSSFLYGKRPYGMIVSTISAFDMGTHKGIDFEEFEFAPTEYLKDTTRPRKFNIGLKGFMDWLKNTFQVHWVMTYDAINDWYYAELIHISDIYTTVGTLDLSTETEHLNQGEFLNKILPTSENWSFDRSAGVYIQYPFFSENIVNYDLSKWERDVLLTGTGDVDDGKMCLVRSYPTGGTRQVYEKAVQNVGTIANGDFHIFQLLEVFWKENRYHERAVINSTQEIDLEVRPLIELPPINISYSGLLSEFDMARAVTTSVGSGNLMEFTYGFKENKTTVKVHV